MHCNQQNAATRKWACSGAGIRAVRPAPDVRRNCRHQHASISCSSCVTHNLRAVLNISDLVVHTIVPRDTSKATAASRLQSITTLHEGSSLLKRAQQHKARLLSGASRASSIWLTGLPIHNALTLSNSAFCNAFQFRLGLSPRPMHALRVRCGCGALVDPPPGSSRRDFFQHAQKCPQLATTRSARHNILCGTWCQGIQSAGVHTSIEPNCSKVAGSNPRLATGQTSSVSSRTAFCSQMFP